MPLRPLILASSSVYRRSLLERLHVPFAIAAPDIDESPLTGEPPRDTALRLALAKARAVAATNEQALIIGSDQVAELEGHPLGKPGTLQNATLQLRAMRGKSVIFHTALCLLNAGARRHHIETVPSVVQFREISDAHIERYLHIEKPYDCAGSARIESLGIALARKVESTDPTALIGLPLIALVTMLNREGVDVF